MVVESDDDKLDLEMNIAVILLKASVDEIRSDDDGSGNDGFEDDS